MVFGRGKPCCCEFSVFVLVNAGCSPAKQRGALEEHCGLCIGNVNRRSWKELQCMGVVVVVVVIVSLYVYFFSPLLLFHCCNMVVFVGNYTGTT